MNTAESRRAGRVRSFLSGEVVHSGGASRTECIVRDLSDTGAKLQVSSSVLLPENFDLHITQRGLVLKATMVWRVGNEMGVQFQTEPKRPGAFPATEAAPASMQHRIDSLENEIETLRRQLGAMRRIVEVMQGEKG
ncbi:PilZ domain containing protein [Rhabdaerophilaceae bacterium]